MLVRRVVWLVVSLALVLGLGVVGPAGAAPGDGGGSAGSGVAFVGLVRPDWVSASVTARAVGARVEVLSERSETVRVFVLPDGGVEEEVAAGPVRFRDASAVDGWREIDTTLGLVDGVVVPVSLPVDVRVSGGGSGSELVVFDADGAGEVGVALMGALKVASFVPGVVGAASNIALAGYYASRRTLGGSCGSRFGGGGLRRHSIHVSRWKVHGQVQAVWLGFEALRAAQEGLVQPKRSD